MASLLRYGTDAAVQLDIPPNVLIASCEAPRGQAIHDVQAATRRALAAPLDFPPLAQAAVPGDHVALALDHGVPQQAHLMAAVVESLLAAGVNPAEITIVCAVADDGILSSDPRELLPPEIQDEINLELHDPTHRDRLSYLAASSEAKPIYVNRAIHEADLVVPISCLRLEQSLGYHGVSGGVFPAFSDQKTLERYRSPNSLASAVQRKRLRKEADDASWLLGVSFTIQVVPGAGEQVLHVLAGAPQSVIREGQKLCEAAWSYKVPSRASLVVASIEGDSSQQTWENVGRALSSAARAMADDGAIALCTNLEEGPGPALRFIAQTDDPPAALRQIAKERPSDALPATELLHALERGRVYLLSKLEESVVEGLGIAAVDDPNQIARLAQRHPSCIVLANAQHVVPVVEGEE